ncbi:O-succinylbenzoate--CoA ligase [Mycolicibacterium conceptionense]|jgi:fatty-acyl-CoA synthase|uniref:Long-chain-fatty-acid--CoA ligase FadD13 n=3 Tax=Mycolicibacterium TaxID=1866885 RepID=A0A132PEC5_9MYCO|nr:MULTISPECIES: long-chain fatty acid--CoA ligase [Mycolicibacterium]KLI04814.1 O-succinylbenzoate--CoA ligase [Mycolicibacterium senegalense]KLO47472.1 O-succinylbenzoate--CoA ligase [Mycolicibacterium senegalense]KMV14281.1 O-succinylbenzoate--CoA ligase [Mycolicibacterium conceptionense]KWX20680.1 O-succinylbenzoate--CoA ligase [Mycolicibacterium wolinskyi]
MALGIGEWITRRASRTPNRVALVDGREGTEFTYADLDRRSGILAEMLRASGVRRGDRVALLMGNSTTFLELLFAAAKLGAVTVPINFRLSEVEVAYILDDSQASILFHDSLRERLAREAAAEMQTSAPTIVDASEISLRVDVSVDSSCSGGSEPANPHDLAVIMYTSGTTGRPKGAMLTHGNLEWNAVNMLTAGKGITGTDVTVTVAPLFHIGALGLFTLPLLYAGGTVIVEEQFDAARVLELLAQKGVTVQFMVPTMWADLAALPDFGSHNLENLRWLLSGGAPCPLPLIETYGAKGLLLSEGYGMTELSPAALILEEEFVLTKAGSVGRPFLHVETRIVDDFDRDVRQGDVGELIFRGPNVCAGYWGLPDATAEVICGGWFHSGDLAFEGDDGFITLVDRKHDMIISGGENVYPIEVEQILNQHPFISDVAVIGIPHDRWGETVLAVVVPVGQTNITEQEVIQFCRERIAGYKCPRRVESVIELPRNATGKVLKRELRKMFGVSETAVIR